MLAVIYYIRAMKYVQTVEKLKLHFLLIKRLFPSIFLASFN